jgi:hypothetical protein
MVPMRSSGSPINPYGLALRAGAPASFGTNPYGRVISGMRGVKSLGACGCGPVNGCSCDGPSGMQAFDPGAGPGARGLSGLGQSASLDSIISNTFSWLGGVVQTQLPASAALPPAVGSTGALINSLMTYAPYILIGYLAYKAIK